MAHLRLSVCSLGEQRELRLKTHYLSAKAFSFMLAESLEEKREPFLLR